MPRSRARLQVHPRGRHFYEFGVFLVCTQSPGIQMTKGMAAMLVYTTIDCNYNSIVIVHQHGGYDVTYKPRIRT